MFKLQFLSKISATKWLAVLLIGIFMVAPLTVQAARMICRSDPIVFLSDGTRLQFDAAISTDVANVTAINYQLHVPAGVTIDHIVFTPKWARDIETVDLIQDQAPGNYLIVANVDVVGETVDVEITAKKVTKKNGGEGSSHLNAYGDTSAPITVFFGS